MLGDNPFMMNFNNVSRPTSSVNNYLNVLFKLRCNKMNLFFNRTCIRRRVIPKHIKVRINNNSEIARRTKQKAEKYWLSQETKSLYTKINQLTMKLYNLHLQLARDFHYIEYLEILEQIDEKVEKRLWHKRRAINRKLEILIEDRMNNSNNNANRPITSHTFYHRIENHTNIQFSTNETMLLNKGLKYNISPRNDIKYNKKHLLEIENTIAKINIEHQSDIRAIIVEKLKHLNLINNRCNNEYQTVQDIKNKIISNNAIITKADKGNTMVILNANEYDSKVIDFITNNNIEELNNDPTDQYNKNLKSIINKSTHLLNKKEIHCNKMIKPAAPILRGMPKVHKTNMPIRPVVNFTTAPSYKIAKHLNKWITNNLKFDNDYSIKNNTELVDKIEGIIIPNNAKLASFDVTNMYSNIPVKETLEITQRLLTKNGVNTSVIVEVIRLLEEITSQNYFKYKELCYTQTDGLPMGSPLSGTLANIYLNHLENNFILNDKNKWFKYIKYWHRYVDDILLLFTGTRRQLDQLLNYINNIHANIKFTLEIEESGAINFLDLTIKNNNNKHTFKIFRKPTQTDQTIHQTSNHPYQHKMAAYNHMIHRLNNIPMSEEDYLMELNTIKYIAYQNGFKTEKIDELNSSYVNKIQYRQNSTLQFDQSPNGKYVVADYNKNTSHHMQKILKNFGYKVAYKTQHALSRQLRPPENILVDTGVYKLTCSDCPSFYVGQTGRSFKQRFKEHTKDIGKINPESRFALHLNNTLHNYTNMETNLTVLHKVMKGDTMNRLEEFEIYKNRNNPNLLNNKINTTTNKIFDLILNTNNRRRR